MLMLSQGATRNICLRALYKVTQNLPPNVQNKKSVWGGEQWLFEHHVTKCFKSDKLKRMQCNCLSTNLANIGGEIGEEVSKSAVVRADHKLDEKTTKHAPQTSAKAQRVKIKH